MRTGWPDSNATLKSCYNITNDNKMADNSPWTILFPLRLTFFKFMSFKCP